VTQRHLEGGRGKRATNYRNKGASKTGTFLNYRWGKKGTGNDIRAPHVDKKNKRPGGGVVLTGKKKGGDGLLGQAL